MEQATEMWEYFVNIRSHRPEKEISEAIGFLPTKTRYTRSLCSHSPICSWDWTDGPRSIADNTKLDVIAHAVAPKLDAARIDRLKCALDGATPSLAIYFYFDPRRTLCATLGAEEAKQFSSMFDDVTLFFLNPDSYEPMATEAYPCCATKKSQLSHPVKHSRPIGGNPVFSVSTYLQSDSAALKYSRNHFLEYSPQDNRSPCHNRVQRAYSLCIDRTPVNDHTGAEAENEIKSAIEILRQNVSCGRDGIASDLYVTVELNATQGVKSRSTCITIAGGVLSELVDVADCLSFRASIVGDC